MQSYANTAHGSYFIPGVIKLGFNAPGCQEQMQ